MLIKEKCEINYLEVDESQIIFFIDDSLKEWLNQIGKLDISIDLSTEYLFIAGRNSIGIYQDGYSGVGWEESWIVIAKWIGDPIIYDTRTKEILTSMHGIGEWNSYVISPNLEKFDLILSSWCFLYNKYNKQVFDENFEFLSDFIDELNNNLLQIVEQKYVDGFLRLLTS